MRSSKLKLFAERVDKAVTEYFADNPRIVAGEEDEHAAKILMQRNWSKTNPTQSDVDLAEKLVT